MARVAVMARVTAWVMAMATALAEPAKATAERAPVQAAQSARRPA
jgi:hypothetical protein